MKNTYYIEFKIFSIQESNDNRVYFITCLIRAYIYDLGYLMRVQSSVSQTLQIL